MNVIWLHAFPLSAGMWENQLDLFNSLAPNYPGFGGTEYKEFSTLFDLADLVVSQAKKAGFSKPVIVGLSMGGYVAMHIVAKYPDFPSALILCDTRSTADTEQMKKRRLELADEVEKLNSPDPVIKEYLPRLVWKKEVEGKVAYLINQAKPKAIAQALRAMAKRQDMTDVLLKWKKEGGKIYFVCGEKDELTSPSLMQELARKLDTEVYIIPDSGHLPPLENPQEFNSKIVQIISKI